ncbi:MAG TPA: alanine racemase [Caulobacteraceae bacterium]|jgi:alanine racemase
MSASAARLTIDLDALAWNYRALERRAGGTEVAPVVKADGYGLGAAPVARRLLREGARTFFVARVAEGERLRAALGPGPVIYVLDGCPPGAAAALAAADLRPVLNSVPQIEAWAALGRASAARAAALHIDTGMNRLGLRPEEARALAQAPDRLAGVDLALVMSHLACASEPDHPMNSRQLETFQDLRRLFPGVPASISSSGGVFLGSDYGFDMVRPGISLYGGGPFDEPHPEIGTVATLEVPIVQVRPLERGETVGYGAAFTAQAPMRVAVLAGGYADGVLRASSPAGYAWLGGARRRILGRLSMDLIAVDVNGSDAAAPGAMVELLGPHVLLNDAAAAAGTAAYELLVRLGPRAERDYRDSASSG